MRGCELSACALVWARLAATGWDVGVARHARIEVVNPGGEPEKKPAKEPLVEGLQ